MSSTTRGDSETRAKQNKTSQVSITGHEDSIRPPLTAPSDRISKADEKLIDYEDEPKEQEEAVPSETHENKGSLQSQNVDDVSDEQVLIEYGYAASIPEKEEDNDEEEENM